MSSSIREKPTLSIVIPCYNEIEVLPILYTRLNKVLETLQIDSEVILVDDGSKDGTRQKLIQFTQENPRYRAVVLSRNFGHQIALTAGLDQAKGDVIAVLDADLQDPPELLSAMLMKWREGFDVVYGQRISREGETWAKRATAAAFYWVIRKLSGVDIPSNVGDFRLMDRKVVDALKQMPERFRFVRGLVVWAGYKQCPLSYERPPRTIGTTKYPWRKMFRFAFDAIFSFSIIPLRIATMTGFVVMAGSIMLVARTLYLRFISDTVIPGFTALYVVILMLGGLNLIVLGIVGEYMGRMYVEIKGRPLYFIEGVYSSEKKETHVWA